MCKEKFSEIALIVSSLHLVFVADALNRHNAVKSQLLSQVFNVGVNRPVDNGIIVTPQFVMSIFPSGPLAV